MAKPTPEQIKEIEDLIASALELEKEGSDESKAKAAKLKQTAIGLADRYYRIPVPKKKNGKPVMPKEAKYVRDDIWGTTLGVSEIKDADGDGVDDETGHEIGDIDVEIGDRAFLLKGKPSAAILACTKVHEIVGHGKQVGDDGTFPDERDEDDPGYVGEFELEVEAVNAALDFARASGMPKDVLEDVMTLKKQEFDQMPADRQKVWKNKEPWLARFEPPGEKEGAGAVEFRARYAHRRCRRKSPGNASLA